MTTSLDWLVFRTLALEEWRLHARLFGGRRFYAFPLVVAALVVAGGFALRETGYTNDSILAGVHVAALAFGLYSGTAAFAGSDMLENVFGDLSLLLSSADTLPLSRRRLLAHFLLKDALFYGVTMILPLSLVVVALEGLSVSTPADVLGLWLSLWLVFAAGMTATLALIALRTRGLSTRGGLLGVLAVGGAWSIAGRPRPSVSVTDLVLVGAPLQIGASLVAVLVVTAALSVRIYDPAYARPTRTHRQRFRTLESLPGSDPLVAKTLLDLARSSGGVWKPLVSVGILLGLVVVLVGIVRDGVGIEPALGPFFGSVLGLSAFTTYNWLTQFDAVESYAAYPVSVATVFRAKRRAFYLVGLPTMTLAYLVALVWARPPLLDAVVGFVLLVGLALYYYGLTVFVAGFDPNEFLFDAVRFGAFTLGVAVALVPTLVVGFVAVSLTTAVAAALTVIACIAGALGWWLALRSEPRWTRRYRRG
ncbi:hypothetical protein [Natronosalvus halobius]|uniref:hypothetical protein n=1 Tax=Natronosalvus halobius TaxID=2953746 RepID=UPI00209EFC67|nr:hypothetical protein [Natronosalvus halobius]USZ72806.1 hypothetical protein NGM15_05725 [Natronosalvus halobius]